METLELRARAKINIALDVLGKREDGYHELKMIMQTVNRCDNITVTKTDKPGISLTATPEWLPTDERNLMYKAAALMTERFDLKQGISMTLVKRIPVAAGLAGGSSDCAAVLIAVNRLFELHLSQQKLCEIGKELGADVPYCIMRGTVLAEGIGEKLTRLPAFPDTFVLLCKPNINVSTATVFNAVDSTPIADHPDVDALIESIKKGDIKAISDGMGNVLENVTIANYPIIADIKQQMLAQGATGSMMSGSGPTVFGFYESYEKGIAALKKIREKFHIREIYLTTVFNEKSPR